MDTLIINIADIYCFGTVSRCFHPPDISTMFFSDVSTYFYQAVQSTQVINIHENIGHRFPWHFLAIFYKMDALMKVKYFKLENSQPQHQSLIFMRRYKDTYFHWDFLAIIYKMEAWRKIKYFKLKSSRLLHPSH